MTQPEKLTLGAHLKATRMKAGLSIRGLAALADMNSSYLLKIESEQNDNPSAEKLQRLAEVLELDPAELLAFIGVKPASTLPAVRTYFRRKFGVNADEAEVMAQLIEKYREKQANETSEGGDHDDQPKQSNQGGRSETD